MKKSDLTFNKAFKVVSKVLSWALFVILLIAAAFLLYYFIATKIYAAKGPGYEPKFSIYTIVSPSMTPTIKVYDAIINVRVDKPEDLKKGDVITFISTSLQSPGMTITHRIIDIKKDDKGEYCYQTKGDANSIADAACAKYNNIIGRVVFKIPQLGRIQYLLASKAGWLLFIVIPALYIICKDILRITKLSSIKTTAQKMNEDVKDPKKIQMEKERKEELKRKLLKDDKNKDKEYYRDPDIKSIEKKKKNDEYEKKDNND